MDEKQGDDSRADAISRFDSPIAKNEPKPRREEKHMHRQPAPTDRIMTTQNKKTLVGKSHKNSLQRLPH